MNLIQPPRATVNIETFSRNYLDELGRLAADGWLQLKKEETWISTILFEYGKRFYIHGAPVSSALKRASKVSVEGNTGISTLSSEIASVFSNGVAIAGLIVLSGAATPPPPPTLGSYDSLLSV